jgi:hypothetical protein
MRIGARCIEAKTIARGALRAQHLIATICEGV